MSIKIGIAGIGNHALGRIIPAIAQASALELSAGYSGDVERASVKKAFPPNALFNDLDLFLQSDVDVVYVASVTGSHHAITKKALEAGKHVWCEKPISCDLTQTQELIELSTQQNLMLRECFMFEHHAQAVKVKELINAGSIGDLRSVRIQFCFPHLTSENFRYDPNLGGGAFLDHACYLVRALQFYLGDDWTVLGGRIGYEQREVDVNGTASLVNSNGAYASLVWGFGCVYINEIDFVGSTGRMLVNMAFTKPGSRPCDIEIVDATGSSELVEVNSSDPYLAMLNQFAHELSDQEGWEVARKAVADHAELFFGLLDSVGSPTA